MYLGYDLPSIIRYLIPTMNTLFKAKFVNYRFHESKFPRIPIDSPKLLTFAALESMTMNPDPRTASRLPRFVRS